MSEVHNGEIHIDEQEVSAGEKTGHMRWVLLISLLAAVVLMTVIWMAGAFSQTEDESSATAENPAAASVPAAGDAASGVTSDDAAELAPERTVENGLPVVEN